MKKPSSTPVQDFIRPLGIVFGDIGTSPIYTLTAIVLFLKSKGECGESTIFGIISLIFWSLILIVYIQYTWLAMNLSIRGEGGTIILQEILVPLLKDRLKERTGNTGDEEPGKAGKKLKHRIRDSAKYINMVITISFIALSFIIGDGVITPAITILSAVEGLVLIPGLQHTPLAAILLIAVVITIFLFAFQKHGTDKVSKYFSPVMVVWFLSLAGTGIISLSHCPRVLEALNPWHAIAFFINYRIIAFLVLSEVILAVTGGEALYADMGHLGKKSIVNAWHGVFICLILNYLGQGAHTILHPGAKSILFEMVASQSQIFYIFFLLLTVLATVIASQAMISAMFSIVFQGINTHIMPRLKIDHTSKEMSAQIYINFVNWALFICVILMLLIFKKSEHMAVAYGMAVNVTMTLTAMMLVWINTLKREKLLTALSVLVAVIDLIFLAANCSKVPHGGYISVIVALIPLSVILLYRAGQKQLYRALKPTDQATFLKSYDELYRSCGKIHGTAIFLLRDAASISPYMVNTIFTHNIVYENNLILSISSLDKPFGLKSHYRENLAPSLRYFEIRAGYMEVVDIEDVLKDNGINEKVVFYGIEDIVTDSFMWKAFAVIKALSPNIVQFYNLPPQKLHGVITQVKL